MNFLVKAKIESNPEMAIEIGLKCKYKEFNFVEDAFKWIFDNQKQINSYEIFEVKEFCTKGKKEIFNSEHRSVNICSGESIAKFS